MKCLFICRARPKQSQQFLYGVTTADLWLQRELQFFRVVQVVPSWKETVVGKPNFRIPESQKNLNYWIRKTKTIFAVKVVCLPYFQLCQLSFYPLPADIAPLTFLGDYNYVTVEKSKKIAFSLFVVMGFYHIHLS